MRLRAPAAAATAVAGAMATIAPSATTNMSHPTCKTTAQGKGGVQTCTRGVLDRRRGARVSLRIARTQLQARKVGSKATKKPFSHPKSISRARKEPGAASPRQKDPNSKEPEARTTQTCASQPPSARTQDGNRSQDLATALHPGDRETRPTMVFPRPRVACRNLLERKGTKKKIRCVQENGEKKKKSLGTRRKSKFIKSSACTTWCTFSYHMTQHWCFFT